MPWTTQPPGCKWKFLNTRQTNGSSTESLLSQNYKSLPISEVLHRSCTRKILVAYAVQAEIRSLEEDCILFRPATSMLANRRALAFFFCLVILASSLIAVSFFLFHHFCKQITKPYSPPLQILLRSVPCHDVASSPLRLLMLEMK